METESALPVDSSIPDEKAVDPHIELTTKINEDAPTKPNICPKRLKSIVWEHFTKKGD